MTFWSFETKLEEVMFRFKSLCGLPSIHGTLDGTHFPIVKHVGIFNEDYNYHNNEGYTIVCCESHETIY
jgi:hypothetical protein